jgi:NitT/TauT family transport system substrate-binding protein
MNRFTRRVAVLAVVAGAALLPVGSPVAGQSPSPVQGAASPGGAAAVECTPAAERSTIRLQLSWVEQAQFAGYYVARDKGYYDAVNLDVEILPGGPNVSVIQQLGAGAADFGIDSALALFQARDTGVPVVAVAQTDQRDGFIKVARADSGITRYEDIVGKVVGNFPDEWEFDALIAKLELEPGTDFTLVQQGFTMDPFISGELDVASATLWNEYNVLIEGENPPFQPEDLVILSYDDYEVAIPHDALITSETMIADNRDAAVAFLCASFNGWRDAYANPAEAIDIVMNVVLAGTEQSSREHQQLMLEAMRQLQLPEGFDPARFGWIDPVIYEQGKAIADTYLTMSAPVDLTVAYRTDLWEEASGQSQTP